MNFKDLLHDVLPVIEKTAPTIATALGSPAAGIAVKVLCDSFGCSNNDIPNLISNIQQDSDANSKITNAEGDYLQKIAGLFASRFPLKASLTINLEWEPMN